jgi:ribonuclease E
MTTKRMLIDASHQEETRVAIVSGQHLEDFDVEVESRRQLRGNIYLAKVTRVEPSLQAAFVDYGGNRHGFLAFSEIHPDYYQIPVADREALVAEQQEAEAEAIEKVETKIDVDTEAAGNKVSSVETVGGDEADDVEVNRPIISRRRYKIQEVVKRRQILLIQVVKEERGSKGAALTTYLSLAGRYCVLMPNTARGGGISRKITNLPDRKRLKKILSDLDIPGVMAVIVRTAGQKRSKAEIKRDYEYLIRLWESLREVTLESMAPCLVHEEGNLIKRSIRDLYNKEIGEIIIDGDIGYRTAKDFMKLLIPSHTKRVQPFKETGKQLFQHFHVESQLDSMHSPEARLKSGGYIVINPTEALVSIDVNSGRATRGRNIEETALKTNLEASDEIARQLKLRDLAGLIVIDYIDMEVSRNQTKVELRLKEAMRSDRARIQIGRISPFGLLELSRQRMRPSLIETSSDPCPHCEGTGIRRSDDSAALHLLRAIKEEALKKNGEKITVYTPTQVALHIFNNQRDILAEIEENNKISITFENDDTLIPPSYRLELDGEKIEQLADHNKTKLDTEDNGRRRKGRGRRRRIVEEPNENVTNINEGAEGKSENEIIETTQNSIEEKNSSNNNRRRRGRRGGRRRGRKPLDKSPLESADNQVNGVEDGTQILDIQDKKKVDINISTPKPKHVVGPIEDIASKEENLNEIESKKLDKGEVKRTTKRTRIQNLNKSNTKPTAKKEIKKAEQTLISRKKEKPSSDPQLEIKTNLSSKTDQKIVPSKQSDQKPVIAVAESAKTQVISVGSEKNEGNIDKKARKGWWK